MFIDNTNHYKQSFREATLLHAASLKLKITTFIFCYKHSVPPGLRRKHVVVRNNIFITPTGFKNPAGATVANLQGLGDFAGLNLSSLPNSAIGYDAACFSASEKRHVYRKR